MTNYRIKWFVRTRNRVSIFVAIRILLQCKAPSCIHFNSILQPVFRFIVCDASPGDASSTAAPVKCVLLLILFSDDTAVRERSNLSSQAILKRVRLSPDFIAGLHKTAKIDQNCIAQAKFISKLAIRTA